MIDGLQIRPARKEECETIARFYQMSSDGVADYIWTKLAEPGENPIEVGARRYARENTEFSYQNCWFATLEDKPIAMLFAFHMAVDPTYEESDPVLQHYAKLEEDCSYYISGVAVEPEHRGKRIGQMLMGKAHTEATNARLERISLLVFEQNEGAVRLYEKLGFKVIGRADVYPHELIHFTGEVLLMSREAIKPKMWLGTPKKLKGGDHEAG